MTEFIQEAPSIICLRRIIHLRRINRLDINPMFRRILAPNSSRVTDVGADRLNKFKIQMY